MWNDQFSVSFSVTHRLRPFLREKLCQATALQRLERISQRRFPCRNGHASKLIPTALPVVPVEDCLADVFVYLIEWFEL